MAAHTAKLKSFSMYMYAYAHAMCIVACYVHNIHSECLVWHESCLDLSYQDRVCLDLSYQDRNVAYMSYIPEDLVSLNCIDEALLKARYCHIYIYMPRSTHEISPFYS